ncbi:hypothetical protein GJ744_002951 [Endocarpon pusillum]|uniref:Uncharacterized protein n=1 Tax=Endocarpon pusillum TaxID=364733 RepID=A0A8H7AB87_9EURO|nr:hypothetical protein GJ744_002951 [Endocarpon pusillum]
MSGIHSRSSYKDQYIGRLETDLASARHQILILKARCAMLGDTGDNRFLPSRPTRQIVGTPSETNSRLEMKSSGLVRSVQTRRKQDLGLRRRHAPAPLLFPKFEIPQSVSGHPSFPHKRLSTFAAGPKPSPGKRAVLRAPESPVRPSKKLNAGHHYRSYDPLTRRLAARHLPYATRASQCTAATTRDLSNVLRSATRHQQRPAANLPHSPEAVVNRSPGHLRYLRSRRHHKSPAQAGDQLNILPLQSLSMETQCNPYAVQIISKPTCMRIQFYSD